MKDMNTMYQDINQTMNDNSNESTKLSISDIIEYNEHYNILFLLADLYICKKNKLDVCKTFLSESDADTDNENDKFQSYNDDDNDDDDESNESNDNNDTNTDCSNDIDDVEYSDTESEYELESTPNIITDNEFNKIINDNADSLIKTRDVQDCITIIKKTE